MHCVDLLSANDRVLGEILRKDEDGEFFFFDRKVDYIRYNGRNVFSFAVEAAVNAPPAVARSAACGVKSAELDADVIPATAPCALRSHSHRGLR
jgi:acyl-coenzyme A synthetase/AMP-(fatty) acid ligase